MFPLHRSDCLIALGNASFFGNDKGVFTPVVPVNFDFFLATVTNFAAVSNGGVFGDATHFPVIVMIGDLVIAQVLVAVIKQFTFTAR